MAHTGANFDEATAGIYKKVTASIDIRIAVNSGRYLDAMNIHRDRNSTTTDAELLTLISLHKLRKELENA